MSDNKSFFEKLMKQEKENGAGMKIQTAKVVGANIDDEEEPVISHAPKNKQDMFTDGTEGQLIVDVFQTPNEIVIKSTIAGVEAQDLDISITHDMVTIKGERRKDEDITDADYFYQECYWGKFNRSIILPTEIEPDKAKAILKSGILTVKLPKSEKDKVKKLRVQSM